MTTDLEEADRLDAGEAGASAMALRRWTLHQAVAWAATRTPEAVAQDASGTRLAVWVTFFPGSYPFPRYDDAWRELAVEMAHGSIVAFATEIQRDKLDGGRLERPGVRFPPIDQPGLALACHVAGDDRRGIVRPNDAVLAVRWTEYGALTFDRAEVVAAFPPLEAAPDPTAALAPAILSRPQRAGSKGGTLASLIEQSFPGGVPDGVASADVMAAIRDGLGPALRNTSLRTLQRAILASRKSRHPGDKNDKSDKSLLSQDF